MTKKQLACSLRVAALWLWWILPVLAAGPPPPLVFPFPREARFREPHFLIDPATLVLVPEQPSESDLFLARFFIAEITDRYGVPPKLENARRLPPANFVLIGSVANPLVREYASQRKLQVSAGKPGPEGYVLEVGKDAAVVAGSDERGAFYGLQSLRQLVERRNPIVRIHGASLCDWPYKPFRGVKVFLPGRDNIPFFRRFLRDFVALYKYNKLILEVNAAMRLDRRPELNAGWIEFASQLNYSRRDRPEGPGRQYQDSAHHDTADGGVLEKEEVAGLVRYANRHFIEVIPEIPSLTHSYYLLTRHRELAEIQAAEWPDTYCPLNPDSYKLLFDVFDEYIEVTRPKMIHIGHDEWRMPVNACPRCKGKDYRELFLQDLLKIHGFLAARGIRTAIWGDHILERVRGSAPQDQVSPAGFKYRIPQALSPEQVRAKLPRDILIFNWFWDDLRPEPNWGESNDRQLVEFGFQWAYSNFTPAIKDYGRRSSRPGLIGGAPSSWAASTEFNLGKDRIHEFIGCANLLWSTRWPGQQELSRIVQGFMPAVRRNLSGKTPPSESGDPVAPLSMRGLLSSVAPAAGHARLDALKSGLVSAGKKRFQIGASGSPRPDRVVVGEDVSSVIFLHACEKPAGNDWVDQYVYNPQDTADLLGWYEVIYEDGLVETVPVRYGVNILEWDWAVNPSRYCYAADPVDCGNSLTFFAFEWVNPRLGKAISEIRLRGAAGFRNTRGEILGPNAVVLAGLSVVRKRPFPQPPPAN